MQPVFSAGALPVSPVATPARIAARTPRPGSPPSRVARSAAPGLRDERLCVFRLAAMPLSSSAGNRDSANKAGAAFGQPMNLQCPYGCNHLGPAYDQPTAVPADYRPVEPTISNLCPHVSPLHQALAGGLVDIQLGHFLLRPMQAARSAPEADRGWPVAQRCVDADQHVSAAQPRTTSHARLNPIWNV